MSLVGGESKLPPMRVVFKDRKWKTSSIQKMIDYCLCTTNIGEENEAILRGIVRSQTLSENQMKALHEIAVRCAEVTDPYCIILRTAKFDEPVIDLTESDNA